MKRKKRVLSLFLICVFLFGLSAMDVSALITSDKYEISLGEGVTLEKINELYSSGVQYINVVTIDLNNPDLKMELLFNQNGISKRGKLTDLVNQENGIIAAVNADFFSMSENSFSIGAMAKNGKQLSNPHYKDNLFATFLFNADNTAYIRYVNSSVSVTNNMNGTVTKIAAINKPGNTSREAIIYTREYRTQTLGSSGTRPNLAEVIVKDDVVSDVRVNKEKTDIPSDGYAIIADMQTSGQDLSKRFSVGDEVKLDTSVSLNYPDAVTAVGGGSMLFKDGIKTAVTKKTGGKAQRTAIAVTNDNKVLLVTVDGRGMKGAIGMDETDMQNFFSFRNVKDAMMFDGGGSTEMVADKKIENIVSSERPVINGIGVKNITGSGNVSTIEITPLKKVLVAGQKIPLQVKCFDSGHNLVLGERAVVSSSGVSGKYDGKNYVFSSGGTGKLVATAQNKTAEYDVEVIGVTYEDKRNKTDLTSPDAVVITDTSSNTDSVMDKAVRTQMINKISGEKKVLLFKNSDNTVFKNIKSDAQKLKADSGLTLKNTRIVTISDLRNQWIALNTALSSDNKNIVIFIEKFPDLSEIESDYFNRLIHKDYKEKNILIVEKSQTPSYYREGDVSRIKIPDLNKKVKSLDDYKYLKLKEENGEIFYSLKPVF